MSSEIKKRNFESNLISYKNNPQDGNEIAELHVDGEVSRYDIAKYSASHKITYPSNIRACIACMHAMKIEFNSYCEYFDSFKGLPHRTELIHEYKNIQYRCIR